EVDPAVVTWLHRHREDLDAAVDNPDLYLPMYLPRCVFGMFLADWLEDASDEARRLGVTIDRFPEEAIAASCENGCLHVEMRHGRRLEAKSLILALGSLPPDLNPELQGKDGYIQEWRMPDGGNSLREMVQAKSLAKSGAGSQSCNAIIIGSHAAAMESLYTIAHDSVLSELLQDICVISPSGRLPQAVSSREHKFHPVHLPRLLTAAEVSADDLISAAFADAAQAERDGLSPADSGEAIVGAFREVFPLLSAEQKLRFVEHHGARFTTLNRHTPPDYADAAAELRRQGKLRNVAGKVLLVLAPEKEKSFKVIFQPSNALHPEQTETLPADIVINCRGAGLLSRSENPFLRSLLHPQRGIARINRSGQGISVSAEFEASPEVFVVGPLLAGHSEGAFHLWNLERAERIEELAKRTAGIISERILFPREPAAVAG
ncbi:MAG: FAD/NAD(P)-binding protein, partial [Candidatus Sulfotelmatobacter sp.]